MSTHKDTEIYQEELIELRNKKIAVIGCGSLGGYVLEMAARYGIGEIVVVDDEVVNIKNINRQIVSKGTGLGKYKVNQAVLWIKQVNPHIYVKGIVERLKKENAMDILKGVNMVFDCVDNVETKFILQETCEKLNIPLIHGAVDGWKGQVSSVLPKDRTLDKIYPEEKRNLHINHSSYIPAAVAAYQVSECIKIFLNKGEILKDKVIYIDLFENSTEIVSLD